MDGGGDVESMLIVGPVMYENKYLVARDEQRIPCQCSMAAFHRSLRNRR